MKNMTVTGWPIATMSRGRFVVRGGKLVRSNSDGRYFSRRPPLKSGYEYSGRLALAISSRVDFMGALDHCPSK
jgi:hypothetical protein